VISIRPSSRETHILIAVRGKGPHWTSVDWRPVSQPALTLAELEAVIRRAWSKETSDDPDEWTDSNRARGQCGVTAMALYQLFGGLLLVSDVSRGGIQVETHYWNRLPSGLEIDLTREQFCQGETFGESRTIDPCRAREPRPDHLRRARLLLALVTQALRDQAASAALG